MIWLSDVLAVLCRTATLVERSQWQIDLSTRKQGHVDQIFTDTHRALDQSHQLLTQLREPQEIGARGNVFRANRQR